MKQNFFLVNIFIFALSSLIFSQNIEPTQKEKDIYSLNEKIKNNPNLQVGSIDPNSTPSLPLGIVKNIGGTAYIIAIDQASFKNDKAVFSAYMCIDFPGSPNKLAFEAENINFNPAGILVTQGVKLKLVADNLIHLGPNVDLFLKGDGSNYIEFDCNGYKIAHFNGEFRFKGDMLIPTTPNAQYVTATLDVTVEDLHNLYASITFSPFEVKGLKDYKFEVSQASVDLSDFQNPTATLPTAYTGVLGADLNLWRGFYLQNLTVTLPSKFDKGPSTAGGTTSGQSSLPSSGHTGGAPAPAPVTATAIFVHDLFIDNSGVTGVFGALNVLPLNNGDASGWGFSVSKISLALQSNVLTGGVLEGKIRVPVLDEKEFSYTASITKAPTKINYTFTVAFANNTIVPISKLKSTLTLNTGSVLSVTDVNPQNKFLPSLVLFGKLAIATDDATMGGFTFQNLNINTVKPFIHGGSFGIVGTAKFANFTVTIDNINITKSVALNELYVKTGFGIKFGDGNTTFSGSTKFTIVAKYEYPNTDNKHLKYDRFDVNSITLACSTSAFVLNGVIIFKKNDPVFGKLFYGDISLKIKKMTEPIIVRAGFGKTSGVGTYKYWYTDAQIPVNFALGQISLTKFIGGASYHVKQTQSDLELMTKANSAPNPNAVIPFVPDNLIGLKVKVGVGYKHTAKETIINGQAILSMTFFSSGGLQNVNFVGEAYMLVDIAHRQDLTVANKIHATIDLNYDVDPKRFDATIVGDLKFANCIDGALNIKLHIEPNNWYFWFNRPSNRASLNVRRTNGTALLTASTYLMFGNTIDPLPALPGWAQSISNVSATRDVNTAAAATGNGLVTGMQIHTGMDKVYNIPNFPKYKLFLALTIDAGFDLMVMQYSENARCGGNTFGMNQRYCEGNLYFKTVAVCGARHYKDNGDIKKTYDVFNVNLVGLLQGKFPKPTYISGNVEVAVKFGPINLGKYHFDFDMGDNCTITN